MFWHRHDWTDWSVTEKGNITFRHDLTGIVGTYLIQGRHCLSCGKTQIDRQDAGQFQNGIHQLVPTSIKTIPKHDKVK